MAQAARDQLAEAGSAVAGNDAIIDHQVLTRKAFTRPSTFRVLLLSTACG